MWKTRALVPVRPTDNPDTIFSILNELPPISFIEFLPIPGVISQSNSKKEQLQIQEPETEMEKRTQSTRISPSAGIDYWVDPDLSKLRSDCMDCLLKPVILSPINPLSDIARSIVENAKNRKSDLIILLNSDPRGKKLPIAGTPLGRALILAEVDTIFIPFHSKINAKESKKPVSGSIFNKILIPVDFSSQSRSVLSILSGFPQIDEIILCHIINNAPGITAIELRKKLAEKKIEIHRDELKSLGFNAISDVRVGKPAQSIHEVAQSNKATVIVMSRVGQMDSVKGLPLGEISLAIAEETNIPVFFFYELIKTMIVVRELRASEFTLANELWIDYHGLTGSPESDRIFCVFINDAPVSVARITKHPNGYEVDGVFTPEKYRGHGYAKKVMGALVEACHNDTMYMYAVSHLVGFYRLFDFYEISESELPDTIKERYKFAMGDMEGSEVQPMVRERGRKK